MREQVMYIDNSGQAWPTKNEARLQDARRAQALILQDFAELENSMRERLQNMQSVFPLADVIARMTASYEQHIKPTEVTKNVGHNDQADGRDATRDAGSDAASGKPNDTGGASEDKETGQPDHLDGI